METALYTGIATGLFSLLQYFRMKTKRELVASPHHKFIRPLSGWQEAGK
jgi:hypothetical protein